MQTVGDERDRAEQDTGDDLDQHHDPAQQDYNPGSPLVVLMTFAEEHVIARIRACGGQRCHGRSYFE